MTNNKYIKWVKEAWSVLENDFLNQKFLPQGEFDIQAHMYFCLLKHRPKNIKKNRILTGEWQSQKSTGKIDLAVIGSDKITPKLLIEIKETNETKSEKRPKAVMKIISKDIEKLKEVAKLYPEKPQTVICFFYRSRKNGIPLQFETDLEKEAKRIEKENILFLFGPKKKIT